MKNIYGTIFLASVLIFITAGFCLASGEIKYAAESIDLFGIRLDRPADWKMEVRADYVSFESPESSDTQLVLLDVGKTDSSLDQFLNDYKDPSKNKSLEEFKLKLESSKAMEVDGLGAYYLRFTSDKKEFGHILFVKNNHQYILALKAQKARYSVNEPILLKAAESLKFYKVK